MTSLSYFTAYKLRIWLSLVAALIALMVLVGGATRLTESGLSITEWKPISGILPPLNHSEWQDEFQKYQATTEYKEINRGMALGEFKTIYWWEWTHRFLGRLIGLVYALPFFFFLMAKELPRPLLLKLGGILLLGALQGAIGWWMVASGLVGRVDVAAYRLAVHLTLALIIFACVLHVAFSLQKLDRHAALPLAHDDGKGKSSIRHCEEARLTWQFRNNFALLLLVLIFLQIFLGGLVAGMRAGYIYNTWPLMDGSFVPYGLFRLAPWGRNFYENTEMVQFLHRMNAYVLLGTSFYHALRTQTKPAVFLLLALIVQAGLGIATLLSEMNFAFALAHQAGIIFILAVVVSQYDESRPRFLKPDRDRQ